MEENARVVVQMGTDPEVFIVERATGRPVPAHRVGFNDKSRKSVAFGTAGLIFRDGYAVEINTTVPYSCRANLSMAIRILLREVISRVGPKYTISTVPTMKIKLPDDLMDAPADVLTFGCEPSLDAYAGQQKPMLIDAMTHDERYIAGHLHFSTIPKYYPLEMSWLSSSEHQRNFIKLCDLFIGLPLTCLLHRPEQYQRRRWYGQAGEYRVQNYGREYCGLEYRTPGADVWNKSQISNMALGIGRLLMRNYTNFMEKWDPAIEGRLQKAINTGEGRFDLLQVLEGFYSPDLIHFVAHNFNFFDLSLVRNSHDHHSGWYEWNQLYTPLRLVNIVKYYP